MSKGKENPTERVGEPSRAGRDGFADADAHASARGDVAGVWEKRDRTLTEITRLGKELAQARERERELEELFRTILGQSTDGVYRRDLKTDRYDHLSPAFERITGFTVEEFGRLSLAEIELLVHPDDRAVIDRRVTELKRSRDGGDVSGLFEYRLMRKDGVYRWLSDSGVIVFGPDGEPRFYVGVVRDITEFRRMEEDLRRNNERLERTVADRTARLRRLAADLALTEQRERKRLSDFLHDDLQQVLVAAKFACEALAADPPAVSLADGTRRVCGLLVEALDKTRSVSRDLGTPLLYLVGFVPALRQLAGQMAQRHGLLVEVEAEDVPDGLTEAVRFELFQAVRELLINVVKHAGTDKATVRVGQPDGRFEVSVADGGKGFDAEAALSGNRLEHGYGLYRISERIAAMGGRLSVRSSPGHGAVVTLSVPSSPERVSPQQPSAAAIGQEEPRAETDGRFRVLVADDHDVVRQGIVSLLEGEPSLTVAGEALNGLEAVELARRLRPDVLVMDIRMPKMDGIEATRLIKAEFREIIVVGISAFCEGGFVTAMREAGTAELLDKAEAGKNLVPTILRCLAARTARK